MIDIIRDNIQKEFVRQFNEQGIDYYTNKSRGCSITICKTMGT